MCAAGCIRTTTYLFQLQPRSRISLQSVGVQVLRVSTENNSDELVRLATLCLSKTSMIVQIQDGANKARFTHSQPTCHQLPGRLASAGLLTIVYQQIN